MRGKVLAGLGLVMVGVWTTWYLLRPDPLPAAAVDIADAYSNGDARVMLHFASKQECDCSALTEKNVRDAWEVLLRPIVSKSQRLRQEPGKKSSNLVQATNAIWFNDSKGSPWSLGAIANQTDDGPKATLIFPMLSLASMFGEDQTILSPANTVGNHLAALRKYKGQLRAAGIEKVLLNPKRCMTWDELEEHWVQALKREKANPR